MQSMHVDGISSAPLQDGNSVSEVEEGAAVSLATQPAAHSVVGFNLQQPASRYPYHGGVRPS
jgi:hypothetical protein